MSNEFNQVLLTLDIDWAPDFAVDFVRDYLVNAQIKATWFITHLSPAIKRLAEHPDLFEMAIHPNFLENSTHGSSPGKVLEYCFDIIPDAKSVRTHGLAQSTNLLEKIIETKKIVADVSLFMPYVPFLRPFYYFWKEHSLIRIPYYWEDDFEWNRPSPTWDLTQVLSRASGGLQVLDFHPIHIYLNSSSSVAYQSLKDAVPNLNVISEDIAQNYIQDTNNGVQTTFLQLVDLLASNQLSCRIDDLSAKFMTQSLEG